MSGSTDRFVCSAVFQFDGGVMDFLHPSPLTIPTRLSASCLQQPVQDQAWLLQGHTRKTTCSYLLADTYRLKTDQLFSQPHKQTSSFNKSTGRRGSDLPFPHFSHFSTLQGLPCKLVAHTNEPTPA